MCTKDDCVTQYGPGWYCNSEGVCEKDTINGIPPVMWISIVVGICFFCLVCFLIKKCRQQPAQDQRLLQRPRAMPAAFRGRTSRV